MTRQTRVFLIDDHRLVLDGLQHLLNGTDGIQVCGRAGSLAEARAQFKRATPDVMVVDLSLPDGNGLDLLDEPSVRASHCPIIVLSMRDETLYAPEAIRRGARGFVSKSSDSHELVAAIRSVRAGNIHVSPPVATSIMEGRLHARSAPDNETAAPLAVQLGPRERSVFDLIGHGLSTKEIAARLAISPKTVDTYRQRLRLKLHASSASRLTALAVMAAQVADLPRSSPSP